MHTCYFCGAGVGPEGPKEYICARCDKTGREQGGALVDALRAEVEKVTRERDEMVERWKAVLRDSDKHLNELGRERAKACGERDDARAEVSRLTAEVAALKAGGYRRGVEDAARVCDGMYFGLANGDVVARETARAAYTATAAKIRALLAVEAEAGR